MLLLAHRGFWQENIEKNTLKAFKKSFENNYGIETDIRDYGGGDLVVSHNIADKNALNLKNLLALYKKYPLECPLALNIKADGLQFALKQVLEEYKITNYFVFDMSIPDTLAYIDLNFKVFVRQSELEPKPCLYEKADGIWLDEFYTHWIDKEIIKNHLKQGKKVCIVSPELHCRDFIKEWEEYKKIDLELNPRENLMLCTDYPQKAKDFFNV